ncbi:hypothetical protein ACH4OY_30425, partial [Micromonospora rubida]
ATRFSPGDVVVMGYLLGDRVIIQIADAGTGIPPELLEVLNAELAAPAPMIEVEHIRRQGIATVALLAAEHGLRVRLVPAQPGGTVAEVEIPANRLVITAAAAPIMLPAGPVAGRRAPGGSPEPALPVAAPAAWRPGRPAITASGDQPPAPGSADAPTQALPVVPAQQSTPEAQQCTPVFDEITQEHSPWFEEGATVHLPPAMPMSAPRPQHGDPATTLHGLPKRQRMAAFAPPPTPAPAVPRTSPNGLAATAGAYQRGVGHRPLLPKGQP